MMTRETATPLRAHDRYANKQSFEQPSQIAGDVKAWSCRRLLDKADELAAGKPKDCGPSGTAQIGR